MSETFEQMVTYQIILFDFQGKYRENYQKKCRTYRKKLYLCIPIEKQGKTADVAQLARARDL